MQTVISPFTITYTEPGIIFKNDDPEKKDYSITTLEPQENEMELVQATTKKEFFIRRIVPMIQAETGFNHLEIQILMTALEDGSNYFDRN
jgi:hypothetical protein